MGFDVIIGGALLFAVAIVFHVVLWNVRKPRGHFLALIVVFFVCPSLAALVAVAAGFVGAGFTSVDWASVALLHTALAGVYIMGYPAIQASTPTLAMLLAIGSKMPTGATYDEVKSSINVGGLMDPRLKDLEVSGFAVESEGLYSITARGRAFLRPFLVYRKILGLPTGKG